MLERLTETFIAGVELLEAEGRVARDRAAELASGTVLLILCGVAGLLGLLASLVGITWVLGEAIGMGGALALVGLVVVAGSALTGWIVTRRLMGPKDPVEETDPENRFLYPPEYPE